MVVNETRRRLLRQLNSRYILGKYPLLHVIIFVIQFTMVTILVRKFNAYYANRPVLTTMITNALLGGIADTVAQTLTALQQRKRQKLLNPDSPGTKDDFFSVEISELDSKKVPWPEEDYMIPLSKRGPQPFDFERLTRFMAYGFMMAPVQHKWFSFLEKTFPIAGGKGTGNALRRVAFDQLIFAPCGLACFFTFMTVAEGGGKRAVIRKFQDVYMPALKVNYLVWPLVQVLNFRVMPIQFQIPFVSTIGIAWTAYLSFTNSSDEPIVLPSNENSP